MSCVVYGTFFSVTHTTLGTTTLRRLQAQLHVGFVKVSLPACNVHHTKSNASICILRDTAEACTGPGCNTHLSLLTRQGQDEDNTQQLNAATISFTLRYQQ